MSPFLDDVSYGFNKAWPYLLVVVLGILFGEVFGFFGTLVLAVFSIGMLYLIGREIKSYEKDLAKMEEALDGLAKADRNEAEDWQERSG